MERQATSKVEQHERLHETPPTSRETAEERERTHPLLRVQSALGNRALGRLLHTHLHVSQPGDAHEQEAERTADALLRTPPTSAVASAAPPPHVTSTRGAPTLQREASGDNDHAPTPPPATAQPTPPAAAAGEGEPLAEPVRQFFEPRLGQDLSGVRVHTDAAAADSARALHARAYTIGQDIVFGSNQYDPASSGGMRLLAHELVHVAQQTQTADTSTVSRAPVGLYAAPEDGQELFGGSQLGFQPPRFGARPPLFTLPPLKISRDLLFYLISNNLLSPEMRAMLLRGEIVIGEADEPSGDAATSESNKSARLGRELGWLRMRVDERKDEGGAQPLAGDVRYPGLKDPLLGQLPDEYGSPPEPVPSPGVKQDKKDWVKFGLTTGLDLPAFPFKPNIFVGGVTLQLLNRGQLAVETKIGWTQTVTVHIAYKSIHLQVSIDKFGNWEAHLSGPTNYPTPTIDRLKDIFGQGATAVETIARTVKKGVPNPGELDAVTTRLGTVAEPLKYAIDAALGIKDAPAIPGAPAPGYEKPAPVADTSPKMSWSIVAGSGPGPGKLPSTIPEGIPPASDVKPGIYGGFNLTLTF
ncbi:MAG TPA: DUF4157 domain-containing protein [Pyrinomonadaceae bacterium]|nr:DUF4157 domain-containing protein [Pyrinomonadaceae bacterium]